jgi:succinate dehydrogenase / fumarate reductase iron-sulfur subunit
MIQVTLFGDGFLCSAKVSHLALLPQGQVEAKRRVQMMVAEMDEQGFGNCTNTGACEAECPKGIKLTYIARMNREFIAGKMGAQKMSL